MRCFIKRKIFPGLYSENTYRYYENMLENIQLVILILSLQNYTAQNRKLFSFNALRMSVFSVNHNFFTKYIKM